MNKFDFENEDFIALIYFGIFIAITISGWEFGCYLFNHLSIMVGWK